MYQIRQAEGSDGPGIVAVAAQTWKATYEGILPESVQAQALTQWPAHQGHGLGRRLLQAGLNALAQQQPVKRISPR